MKFLQRPKEHQDELPVDDSARQQTKKSRKQLQEEEVSTYFVKKPTSGQPAIASRQSRPPTQAEPHNRKSNSPDHGSHRVRGQSQEAPKAAVELTEKAFLGFGSRGPAPEKSGGAQATSNSYFTWSESVAPDQLGQQQRKPSQRPTAPKRTRSDGFPGAPSSRQQKHRRRGSKVENEEAHGQTPAAGRWLQTKRAKGPSLVEVYQPVTAVRPGVGEEELLDETGYSPRLPKTAVPEDAQSVARSSQREPPSNHTSDILRIRNRYRAVERSPSLATLPQRSEVNDGKENVDSSTSTPTSKLLRHAFGAVTHPDIVSDGRMVQTGHHSSKTPATTGHYFGPSDHVVPGIGPGKGQTQEPRGSTLPERGPSRSREVLRHQGSRSLRQILFISNDTWRSRQPVAQSTWQRPGENENLAETRRASSYPAQRHFTYANGRQAEELVRQLASDHEQGLPLRSSELLDSVSGPGEYDATDLNQRGDDFSYHGREQVEGYMAEFPSVRAESIDERPGSDRGVRNGSRAAVDMPNFWRPNVLY
ncbi:Hypothetical predicted protein [Lecanosticta acicola]|uniref:Uncharacterized protein n=1 Tax=Lecanosticta acicola TaxID=111012 RepID=A0AAI9ECY6_9PEZI|nr:Hypothetical predicted protein [Lecanosticta acicola]